MAHENKIPKISFEKRFNEVVQKSENPDSSVLKSSTPRLIKEQSKQFVGFLEVLKNELSSLGQPKKSVPVNQSNFSKAKSSVLEYVEVLDKTAGNPITNNSNQTQQAQEVNPNSSMGYFYDDFYHEDEAGDSGTAVLPKEEIVVEVTPTPTPTITESPTLTPTPTPTLTQTLTPSPTLSNTPSPTPTLTITAGATPTATLTLTPTPTLSPSPTVTPTNTPTVSPTRTLTPSLTPTITPSTTPAITPTRTLTPSPTPTLTPSPTPTITPTNSYNRTLVIPTGANTISNDNVTFLGAAGDSLSYNAFATPGSIDAVTLQIYIGATFVNRINTYRPFILNNGPFTITTPTLGTRTSTFNSGTVINSTTYRITF